MEFFMIAGLVLVAIFGVIAIASVAALLGILSFLGNLWVDTFISK